MKLEILIKKIFDFSRLSIQEKWDNSGSQIIINNLDIEKALLCLDVSEDVLKFAIDNKINLIISHHPLIFSGIKSININKPNGRIIIEAIKNNINIISLHTNIDKVVGGLADFFCKKIGLRDVKPLSSKEYKLLSKIVTFIPEEFVEKFLNLFEKDNISVFDGYKACTFYTNGVGTFYPFSSSNPFCGEKEKLNKVNEIRIELTVNRDELNEVVQKLRRLHPYEVPVIDIYQLNLKGELIGSLGRVGRLAEKVKLKDFLLKLKNIFNLEPIKFVSKDTDKEIYKIAVCPGSGMSLISDVKNSGAEVYLTGDVKYHEAIETINYGIDVIDLGHFSSEFIFTELLKEWLNEECNIEGIIFAQKDIFQYI